MITSMDEMREKPGETAGRSTLCKLEFRIKGLVKIAYSTIDARLRLSETGRFFAAKVGEQWDLTRQFSAPGAYHHHLRRGYLGFETVTESLEALSLEQQADCVCWPSRVCSRQDCQILETGRWKLTLELVDDLSCQLAAHHPP
jgi:hypothetical protein